MSHPYLLLPALVQRVSTIVGTQLTPLTRHEVEQLADIERDRVGPVIDALLEAGFLVEDAQGRLRSMRQFRVDAMPHHQE